MKRYITWNVNGLRAAIRKGFPEKFEEFDADIVALQEIKLQEGQCDFHPEDYFSEWNYAQKKGYSGTAVYCREKAIEVKRGLGDDNPDSEGRVLTLDFDNHYFVCVYTPNSQPKLARLPYRLEWEEAFRNYLKSLDAEKPVIVCGDLNVAHNEIDLKNPDTNHFNAGFSDEEREAFSKLLDKGFIDTFRFLYPDVEDAYTWWSFRSAARKRNVGWRIDYFLVSDRIKDKIKDVRIMADVMGSDHCPVELLIDI